MSVVTPDPTMRENVRPDRETKQRTARVSGVALATVVGLALLVMALAFYAVQQSGVGVFGGVSTDTIVETDTGGALPQPADASRSGNTSSSTTSRAPDAGTGGLGGSGDQAPAAGSADTGTGAGTGTGTGTGTGVNPSGGTTTGIPGAGSGTTGVPGGGR